jgi:ribosomal protein L32
MSSRPIPAAQGSLAIVDYHVEMAPALEERRSGYDRRQMPRVSTCDRCGVQLVVDRRGPTVRLHTLGAYLPAAVSTPTSPAALRAIARCPSCGAPVQP